MKNFQRNLFIVLAIALCGTCVCQWYMQAIQSQTLDERNKSITAQAAQIQDLTNSVKHAEDEVNQFQSRIVELKREIQTNNEWAAAERTEVARLKSAGDLMTNEIIQYKAAVEQLEAKLKEAYKGEKELAAQRDDFVKKLNESIKARNELTGQYNALVDRFNKLQAAPDGSAKH